MRTEAQKRSSRESAARHREANRPAYNAYMREWNARNPEKVIANRRAAYARLDPEIRTKRQRVNRWKHVYKLLPVQVAELFEESDGLCAMCYDRVATEIDHDHRTGAVRGALCGRCNKVLGLCDDDLGPAIRYLALASVE